MREIIVDSFAALDDLKMKDRRDPDKVVAALRANGGRFSVFEVDDALARTLDGLKSSGRMFYPEPQPAFPWLCVEVFDTDMRCKKMLALRTRDGGRLVSLKCSEFAPDGKYCSRHAKEVG